jgi:catechol 2,3-dioxygenase-like lactoylglutathione lyase family enzyme
MPVQPTSWLKPPVSLILQKQDWFGQRQTPVLTQQESLRKQVGTAQLHVGIEDDVDRSKTKAHTAYLVRDLDIWRKRLKEYDFEIIESAPLPNATAFEFRDPFGNRVELIQKF